MNQNMKIEDLLNNKNDPYRADNLSHAQGKAYRCLLGLFRKGLLNADNGLVTADPNTRKLVVTDLGIEAANYIKGQIYDAMIESTNYYRNRSKNKLL